MIKLTFKEFDLLDQIKKYEPTDDKPFKVVSNNNNGSVKQLIEQGLVVSRPKANDALMQEIALTALGSQVLNNEVEYEIVLSHDQSTNEETTEDTKMDNSQEIALSENKSVNNGGYVIETGVPVPETVYTRRPKANTMPLDKLNVGDSFVVPFKTGEEHLAGRKRVGANVQAARKRLFGKDAPLKFVVAIVENGYRVWRTA